MAMFEREIRFIYDFNLNRVKKLGSYLTFEQLISADLHPAILQYISAEIDFLIFEDRQKLLKESVFDYSGKNIAKLFNQIDEEIKRTKKFSIEYINKILLHSTSFTINYLVRPRWTLSQFLFDNEHQKNSTEIKQILNYVYFYSYLKDTLVSYFDKKKIVSITRTDFETLIAKVDKLGIDTYLPTIIDTSIKSISEVFNIGSVQIDKFPIQAVELFLEEKELHTHLQKLKDVYPGDPRPKVSTVDLRNLLLNIEHIDLSFDPYMEEETIEEESIPEKESPIFEELEDPEDILENESDIVEDEVDVSKNVFIEELSQMHDELSEESDSEPVEENPFSDEFDQKMNEVISTIEQDDKEVVEEIKADEEEVVISVAKETVLEPKVENIENEATFNDEQNKAVADEYFDVPDAESNTEDVEEFIEDEEEIAEQELDKDEVSEYIAEEESADRKQKEIKSGDTTITINYPQGYDLESENEVEEQNIEDEVLEEDETNLIDEDFEPIEENRNDIELDEAEELMNDEAESEDAVEEFTIPEEEEAEQEEIKASGEEISESVEEEIVQSDEQEQVEELLVDTSLENTELVEDSTITEEVFGEENISESDAVLKEIENNSAEKTEIEKDPSLPNEAVKLNSKKAVDEMEDEEPELFPREEVESKNEIEESLEEDYYSPASRIDISELLENKNMTKIIKVVFDYDMEDFANTIEQISECSNKEEADSILEKLYNTNRVKPTSKEAGAFNEIIAEYFASEG